MIIKSDQRQRNLVSSLEPDGPVLQTINTTWAPLQTGEVFNAITVGQALLAQCGIWPVPAGYVAGVPEIGVYLDQPNPVSSCTILETPV
jgi:hypothetical protein